MRIAPSMLKLFETHPLRSMPPRYGSSNGSDPWDYVMVFPAMSDEDMLKLSEENRREEILMRLHAAGLETMMYYSVQEKEVDRKHQKVIFCKIRASEERLRREAECLKLFMPLNSKKLELVAKSGLPEHNIAPFELQNPPEGNFYQPYQFIYAPYSRAEEHAEFFKPETYPPGLYSPTNKSAGEKKPLLHDDGAHLDVESPVAPPLFSSSDRNLLVENIIRDNRRGARCDIESLMYLGAIIDCYPLHGENDKDALERAWGGWWRVPMDQPFNKIREYFGVRVALYFLFLGHYTEWLLYASIAGFLPGTVNYLYHAITGSNEIAPFFSPLFGAFMAIWTTIYLEHWKRVNSHANLVWGTSSLEEVDHFRPQFHGDRQLKHSIDGSKAPYFSPREKMKRMILSWLVIIFLIAIVCGLVAAIFYLRYDLTKGNAARHLIVFGHPIGSMVAATANVAQITFMSKIYDMVSISLNDHENHRTQMQYENSFIAKTVVFQFVNNYAALFYSAFIKNSIEGCDHSCMYELQYFLAFVFCSRLILGNFNEILIPRFWTWVNRYRIFGSVSGDDEVNVSQAEEELFLAGYDWRGTFDDYLEMVLQFGYSTMFVVAFPFAPLLAFINNYVEIRLDAHRLLKETRRPRPLHVNSIGYWYQVLQSMSAIAICTNAGVVIFTGEYFTSASNAARVWYFTLFVSAMFFFKYVLEVCINDMPAPVRTQLRRQTFLVDKALYHIPDEEQDEAVQKRSRMDKGSKRELFRIASAGSV